MLVSIHLFFVFLRRSTCKIRLKQARYRPKVVSLPLCLSPLKLLLCWRHLLQSL